MTAATTGRALVLESRGTPVSREAELPDGGSVTVRVAYSSLNYKDGLAVTGKAPIIRGDFPFVPGIDLSGIVEQSDDDRFAPGDRVIGTGWGLGETQWGGYAERAKVDAAGLVHLPDGLSLRDAMVVGTAGFTAMLSVLAIEDGGVSPDARLPIAVSGATGGVGSMAVALLAGRGYSVTAATGKADMGDYLRELGATVVVDRHAWSDGAKRPLDSAAFAGAVDAVGSTTLAHLLSRVDRHGIVAACGLAAGSDLATTVMPFILRGVRLQGIDSNTCPLALRNRAWAALAAELDASKLQSLTTEIDLEDVIEWAERILRSEVRGRVVVRVGGEAGQSR